MTSFVIACQPKKAKSITPQELAELVNTKEDVYIIDLRSKEDFNKQHLKEADNIKFDKNFVTHMQQFDKDEILVLYSEKDDESMKAASKLFEQDYQLVYFVIKGYSTWKNNVNFN